MRRVGTSDLMWGFLGEEGPQIFVDLSSDLMWVFWGEGGGERPPILVDLHYVFQI